MAQVTRMRVKMETKSKQGMAASVVLLKSYFTVYPSSSVELRDGMKHVYSGLFPIKQEYIFADL